MDDQAQTLREIFKEHNKEYNNKGTHIITIASGKGGVGKSILACNLGILLSRRGKKVTIMDADFGLANINVIFGILPKYNLYHVYKREKRLRDIILNVNDNLDIIAGASGVTQLANLTEIDRKHFVNEVSSLNNNDYLLIDVGAGISPNVLDMIKAASETYIITTPEPTSVTDAYGIIKAIATSNKKVEINLIVNRVGSFQEAKIISQRIISISEQFLDIKINYKGFIFDDINIVKSIHEQDPLVNSYSKSKASLCFEDIVDRMLNNNSKPVKKLNLKRFFEKLLKAEKKS